MKKLAQRIVTFMLAIVLTLAQIPITSFADPTQEDTLDNQAGGADAGSYVGRGGDSKTRKVYILSLFP